YLVLFLVLCVLPAVLGIDGLFSFIVCMLVAIFWMFKSIQYYRSDTDRDFANTVFKFSIIVIKAICLTMG
ncbi:protoheme IX farnesyltransferase, partial [Francisella tularensis subsp. holarctica]|nr:protoheme IX farnesyltransferase [Francisella tularensis subsp. holarctica]